jgi:hypothetical protein
MKTIKLFPRLGIKLTMIVNSCQIWLLVLLIIVSTPLQGLDTLMYKKNRILKILENQFFKKIFENIELKKQIQ